MPKKVLGKVEEEKGGDQWKKEERERGEVY